MLEKTVSEKMFSYQERGKKGGETTKRKYGQAHYQKIGRKGGKAKKRNE